MYFLLVILISSVFRTVKSYYLQVFLEKCKYVVKKKKILEYITEHIKFFSDDFDREGSDEENSNEKLSIQRV